ncbi:MAG TPA: alginate lyase family protein [Methylomirabilota bacterium]|nr:alginate lyase family protein [Methylomirabilota bacterium]
MASLPVRRTWARVRWLGPARTARAALHLVRRQPLRGWRRLLAAVAGTAVGPGELARALGVPPTDLAMTVGRIRRAFRTRLPSGPDDAKAIRVALEEFAPETLDATLAAADRVGAHVFDLLGSGRVELGPRIDWHRDFKSGHRWDPGTFHTAVRFGRQPGVDVKVPWELSRGHHLPVLAQAYLLSGDERYAVEAVAQIRDWLAANPPQYGVNWACPMDVAIRAVNWLWTLGLLADAPAADVDLFQGGLAGLLAHGRHIRANLELRPDGVTTNHYFADLVGLFYLGLCLPELREAAGWRAFAARGLERELERQVGRDGLHYEASVPYHRLVTEMALSAAILGRHHGVELAPAAQKRLQRMVASVALYTKPNGLAPQVGDADDGRLHVLSGYGGADPRDHRHLLAAGALLFERDDWWAAAGPAWSEALWLGGTRGHAWARPAARPARPPASAALRDAGLYVLRAGADYVLVNAGPVGTGGVGTHKHNDLLALEVHLGGEDIVVDPGTYCYTSDPAARDAFRSTAAHATVMVDGEEQNRFVSGGLFTLYPDATPRVLVCEMGPTGDRVVAEHDGYRRLAEPIIHRRSVTLERATGRVAVTDELAGPARGRRVHRLLWTFPLAPACVVEPAGDGWLVRTGRQRIRLGRPRRQPDGTPLAVETEVATGWVSPRYGVRDAAPVLRWRWSGPLPLAVSFVLERA